MMGVVDQRGSQGDPALFMLHFLPNSLVSTPQSYGERSEMNKRLVGGDGALICSVPDWLLGPSIFLPCLSAPVRCPL